MVEFTNSEELEAWLKTRPREDAVLIAARTALRVLPLLGAPEHVDVKVWRAGIILPSFRAFAVANFAGTWSSRAAEVEAAAFTAFDNAYSAVAHADHFSEDIRKTFEHAAAHAESRASEATVQAAATTHSVAAAHAKAAGQVVNAAAVAAQVAADTTSASGVLQAASEAFSSYSAVARESAHVADVDAETAYGFMADDTYYKNANSSARSSLNQDASRLEQAKSRLEVSAVPLWYGDDPEILTKQWAETKNQLLRSNEGWEVWTTWYDAILGGHHLNPDLELAKCLIPTEIWNQGPATLNAEIARVIAEHDGGRSHDIEALVQRVREQDRTIYDLKKDLGEITESLDAVTDASQTLKDIHPRLDEASTQTVSLQHDVNDLTTKLEQAQKNIENYQQIAEQTIEQKITLEPLVTLWNVKETQHTKRRGTAFRWFLGGLVFSGGAILFLLYTLFQGWAAMDALFPIGSGLNARSILAIGGGLTLFTLLLWFTRLQMRIYLAERHLALDAGERQAFAKSYLALNRGEPAEDSEMLSDDEKKRFSDDAAGQKQLVYAALFRPSQDGIVKDESGLDPTLAAAVSKLLAGK